MMFGQDNNHVQGVRAVNDQILNMADIMDAMSNIYFAQVCWAVIEEMGRHFNKPCVMADFRDRGRQIRWPRFHLQALVTTMLGQQPI